MLRILLFVVIYFGYATCFASPADFPDGGTSQTDVHEEPYQDPNADLLNTSVDESLRCDVIIMEVLEGNHYRGHPNTPAHVDLINSLSRKDYQYHTKMEHGEKYLECSYRVSVLGKRWRYSETWSTKLHQPPDAWCERALEHTTAEIQRVT